MGVVTICKIVTCQSACAASAFRHIITGHFDVNAAWMCAFRTVDLEEAFDFRQDPVERTGLVIVERDRVAVHRIAGPDDLLAFLLHSADQLWQMISNLVVAEAADQSRNGQLRWPGSARRSVRSGFPVSALGRISDQSGS